jgi:hypothetical protein
MRHLVLIIFAFTVAGTNFIHAQNVERPKRSTLEYTIKWSGVDQEKRTVAIKLAIKNVSDRRVTIDRKAVRYKLSFVKHGQEQDDGGVGPSLGRTITGHHSPDVYRGDFLSLAPNGTFLGTETLHLSASENDFFENGYSYSVSLTYGFFSQEQVDGIDVWRGTVESNALCFTLNENSTVSLTEACEIKRAS